jgi:leucyl aminopeptidase
VLPIVENLVSGSAYKPGDILTARNGATIEVNNTDAEGRLILADALALASEWKPRRIIDVATLTGAALAAVGDRFNAVLSSDDRLVTDLMTAGERTFEPMWRLPLHVDYARWMEGKRADLRNIARVPGLAGASMGAEFLRTFVSKEIPYAHIDLAASMQHDASPPDVDGCNGWGVRMLVEFLAKG